jgi:DNA-binding transcriptional regulator YdaS (Cro superfamily)
MEKLLTYINSLSKMDRAQFVAACGTSEGYLRKAVCIDQKIGSDMCINIERASNRAVLCEDLRPDIDWAFLRNPGERFSVDMLEVDQ